MSKKKKNVTVRANHGPENGRQKDLGERRTREARVSWSHGGPETATEKPVKTKHYVFQKWRGNSCHSTETPSAKEGTEDPPTKPTKISKSEFSIGNL